MMDHDAAMRKLSDVLARMRERADTVALGIVVVYEDGAIGSAYESEHNSALIGALAMLEARVISDSEDIQ